MIEIARIEPKKIQRKLLTEEQKKAICKSVSKYHCNTCPLMKEFDEEPMCIEDVKAMEDFIKDYWNEEIEIEEECL
jgi:hypothetical protein